MGKMVRWLDEEIPRDRIPTLRRDLLGVAGFPRWVEAKVVSSKVKSEKWIRLLLHQMCVAIDVATDGHEEDFFPRNRNCFVDFPSEIVKASIISRDFAYEHVSPFDDEEIVSSQVKLRQISGTEHRDGAPFKVGGM
nr:hypothetical protein [Tanacetum cinerariifolium]